ncbi:hypothetical protein ABZ990_19060 [Streptomyces sp. NPDC046203]|uniref:hypothetical protein n=1 Tax=Streptomyces sp. NPDC046203 TaxID=3154602 RepID=UPI0033C37145
MEHEAQPAKQLWVDDRRGRRRMPDPVRSAAVRAVLIVSVTLIVSMVAFLCSVAGSWPAFPMTLAAIAATVVATWSVLDVWITRQVWHQRHGVVSEPSSAARALRRERLREERAESAESAKSARSAGTAGHTGPAAGHGEPGTPLTEAA